MVVFFIVLTILFLISLIFLILCLSNLEIEINNLWFDSTNKKNEKLQDYLLYIRLKLFDRITWIKIKVNKKKIIKIKNSKLFKSKILKKISEANNIKEIILKNKKDIFNINNLKDLNIRVKQLDLEIKLSALDNIITSFSVAIIASLISIIIARTANEYYTSKYRYIIVPIYEYKPILKIKLNCIIDVKIVHIMNIIYILVKKRSVLYDERASNRRTYVCSNE